MVFQEFGKLRFIFDLVWHKKRRKAFFIKCKWDAIPIKNEGSGRVGGKGQVILSMGKVGKEGVLSDLKSIKMNKCSTKKKNKYEKNGNGSKFVCDVHGSRFLVGGGP